MSTVTELGYVGISVSDAEGWKQYATRILGMELLDEGEADRFYLRMDRWHHRFVVHTTPAGEPDDIAYIGWRVADSVALRQIAAKLDTEGIKYRVASKEEARERRVLGLLKLEDPAGNPTEIFYSPQIDAHKPFHPGRPMFDGFKTGNHGMGHLIIRQTDEAAAQRFYTLLGFIGDVEYKLHLPSGEPIDITFVHCNERQHSLGWMLGGSPKRLGHFMFNYEHLDDLGQTHDLARKHGVPIAATLGKHGNDGAYSFYMGTPSRWLIEPGWGGVEASAQQEHFCSDIFGHELEVGEMVGNMKFKPD